MKKITRLTIGYSDGSALDLWGESAESVVRNVDALVELAIRSLYGQRLGSAAPMEGRVSGDTIQRLCELLQEVPAGQGPDQT